jgi:DUF1680 family protein
MYCAAAALLLVPFLIAAEDPMLKLRPVPFTDVSITDSFWSPRRETNRSVSIPINLENLVKAGNIHNLELAAQKAASGFTGLVFMDSDIYKALEAASCSLATQPDPKLEKRLDEIIALIAAAQQPDGYLNTYFIVKAPSQRWTNLRDWHELYCAGHLFEAAVAHHQATGRRNFLEVAVKLADHIDSVFGPGKRMGYPGHPEIELALVKLWRVTGERRHFNLARFFIENRGRKFFAEEHKTPLDRYDGTYWQDDVPIYEHRSIKGHAVRAAYLMSGATDVATETNDAALLRMINRVWRNTTGKNLYLTGGIGPSSHNEGFTEDYDLPNLTAYQETCATIALAQWSHRLALLYGDARFSDVVERALYNGVLAGVSQDGSCFFYVNPLESRGTHHRSTWFSCACCPPNVARTLAALGGYAYALGNDSVWVNLYIQGTASTQVAGRKLKLKVTTDYPWDGKVSLQPELSSPGRFDIRLRIPGWCEGAAVSVNSSKVVNPAIERGYIVLSREWKTGDRVDLNLPMPVQRVVANPQATPNRGLTAIQRGPLVYCVEASDQTEPLLSLFLPLDAGLKAEKDAGLLGGVVAIRGTARVIPQPDWDGKLYQPLPAARAVPFTAVPYYLWDNRKPGRMKVWLPTTPPIPPVGGPETRAAVAVSYASGNSQPEGINDAVEPKSSAERPPLLCHWWPHKNTEEWAQYTWTKAVILDAASVYWFDDTGRGNCRLPVSWQIQVLEGAQWKPVRLVKGDYPIGRDRWCDVSFEPVLTTSLRLVVRLPKDFASGVHEWKVSAVEE